MSSSGLWMQAWPGMTSAVGPECLIHVLPTAGRSQSPQPNSKIWSQGACQDVLQSGQRHLDPVGPIVQFVAQLVDHLVELPGGQHPFRRRGPPGLPCGQALIGIEKRLLEEHKGLPAVGRASTRSYVSQQIVKLATHACHVFGRARLGTPCLQGTGWLPLEVNRKDAAVGFPHKYLPEVVIAVNSDHRR